MKGKIIYRVIKAKKDLLIFLSTIRRSVLILFVHQVMLNYTKKFCINKIKQEAVISIFFFFYISDIDDCQDNQCQNGAQCVDGANDYTCACPDGYTGKYCQTEINECSSNPCQNGAQCVDDINGVVCTCLRGFTGTFCEISKYFEINLCRCNGL